MPTSPVALCTLHQCPVLGQDKTRVLLAEWQKQKHHWQQNGWNRSMLASRKGGNLCPELDLRPW